MNILYLNETPIPNPFTNRAVSGKELRLRNLLSYVDKVIVIARKGESVIRPGISKITSAENKIVVIHHPSWPYYLSGLILFFSGLKILLTHPVDHIEAESPLFSGPAALLLGRIFNKKVVIEVRASYEEIASFRFPFLPLSFKKLCVRSLTNWSLSRAQAVITNSNYYARQVSLLNSRVHVINPGLENTSFHTDVSKKPVIGYIGRLVSEKRIDLLLEAFSLLPKQLKQKYQVEIAGAGPLELTLKKYAQKLNIKDKVTFLGLSDPRFVFRYWQILVNPNTLNHPLEMVNAEAAQLGLPVICFGLNGNPETVEHDKTGIILKKMTAVSLSQAIKVVLEDSDLYRRFSQNGPAFATRHFSQKVQVDRLHKLYTSL